MHQIPVVFQMEGVDTLDTPQTRAQCCNKEKPAERELLTAGVGGSDEIVVRWSNTAWNKFINPRSEGTFNKMRSPSSE